MSANKIEISVKDIPEIIEQLKDLEKELEFERKSKNLFIDDLYKVCEMSLKLQTQLQQKENIIKEVREYIKKTKFKYCDDELCYMIENHYENILEILDKGE